MQLTEVHLRNWRSYRNATFRFPKANGRSGKNVILVGAQNGTGKTSLLIALYLGLFGREAMHLIEGMRLSGVDEQRTRFYRGLIEQTIHRPALRLEEPHCSVGLHFETNDGPIFIQRRWNFSKSGRPRDLDSRDGEEVLLEADGRRKLFTTWQEANARIEEMLFPMNVMPCFFFDGEQAQERVEAAGGKALLDAVETLYGTGMLDELSESLRTFIQNEQIALRKEVGVVKLDELDEKRELQEKKKQEFQQVASELTAKRKEKESAENEQQRLTNELYQLVGDSAADVEEFADAISALQSEETAVRQELVAGLAALSLPLALTRVGATVEGVLLGEQIRDRWLILKDEATGKASKIVSEVFPDDDGDVEPPLIPAQQSQLRAKLERALEALWSPPPEGCAPDFTFPFLGASDRPALLAKLARVKRAGMGDIAAAALRLEGISSQLRETKRKFDKVRDIEPQLIALKASLASVLETIRQISGEVVGFENRERGLAEEMKELKAAIGQMEKRRAIEAPVHEKLDVAHRVRAVVDEAKDDLIPLCKEILSERCTVHFRKMISDEYQKFSVRFDADTAPKLEGPSGQTIYIASLSGAQKRAFGLAFTLAVADVSGQEAPIVVDTPVGNMDSQYRDRVLKYLAEAAPGQVIFLSHDEEISPFYRDKLKSRISKSFLVTFDKVDEGSGMSTVIEDKYF